MGVGQDAGALPRRAANAGHRARACSRMARRDRPAERRPTRLRARLPRGVEAEPALFPPRPPPRRCPSGAQRAPGRTPAARTRDLGPEQRRHDEHRAGVHHSPAAAATRRRVRRPGVRAAPRRPDATSRRHAGALPADGRRRDDPREDARNRRCRHQLRDGRTRDTAALRRVAVVALELFELAVARCVLERRQARGGGPPSPGRTAAADGGERRGGADHAAQRERAEPVAPSVLVHPDDCSARIRPSRARLCPRRPAARRDLPRRAGRARDRRVRPRVRRRPHGGRRVIEIAPEVRDALQHRRPVVALETTLVAHGFPSGEGLDVALESERRVRDAGAVPATVGVLDGAVRVGLAREQLERFDAGARKVGPRDLAACVVQGAVGATTVAGTLAACRVAGIGFLGTGGIGGVHRGYAQLPDVSADLGELARAEVVVACSGVKSLLDVRATVELLETLGVPVVGWRADTVPLFYRAAGGPPVSARVETADETARLARAHWQLGRRSAVLLAQPPAESIDDLEPLVQAALTAADAEGVAGGAVTPFVLGELHRESGGRTLATNRRLVADNAQLAAEVAVAYTALR